MGRRLPLASLASLGLALALAWVAVAPLALGQQGAPPERSASQQAEELAHRRQRTFGLVVAGLTALVGAAGATAILLRRNRSARRGAAVSGQAGREAESAPAPRASEGPEARPKICPTCGERYESRSIRCSADGTELVLLN
jgi:hypothetical protein